MRNMLTNTYKIYAPCIIIIEVSIHPVLSAFSGVALAHLSMHRKKEMALVINGRVIFYCGSTLSGNTPELEFDLNINNLLFIFKFDIFVLREAVLRQLKNLD